MSDCLTALFRLNPRNTVRSLVPICLDERAPTLFKLSLLKACLTLASDEDWLSWNSCISIVYGALSAPLRKVFLELVKQEYNKSEASFNNSSARKLNLGSNDKKQKKEIQMESDQKYELMLDLLRLYRVEPMLAIMGDEEDRFEQNCSLMLGITNCLRDRSQVIRMAAADCLYKLHATNYIVRWNQPNNMMETFWKISSVVVLDLSKQILDNRERDDSLKSLLDLLRRLLATRNDFIRAHQDIALNGSEIRERLQASVALEIALLVLLCSADTEICSGAIACFGHLCTEADLTETPDSPMQNPLTIVENLPVYVELSSGGGLVTGRKAQQKRIRKLLRMISNYTPGNLAAWEEAWKRWKILTQIMTKPVEESREEGFDQGKKHGQAIVYCVFTHRNR
ncbi:Ras GTPase activating protein ira2 [Umbelopsis sp. WA50703]